MKQNRKRLLIAGAMAGASAATLVSGAAVAQSAPAESMAEVVVTGSRVIASGDNSPSPVTVVSTENVLAVQPGTLADALNIMPIFSGSRGSGSNPTSTGSASGGNGSANTLNLRNLGSNRNLVLLDGLRVPPTLINGTVDVDLIPQALVQRVDTVTGGVSAVYGSEAMSGVINYIIDKKFNGVKVDLNGGISRYHDAQKYDFSLAGGTKVLDGRGHIEGSVEYRKERGVAFRSDRPFMNQVGVAGSVPGTTAAAGTAGNPYQLYSNLRQSQFPFGGLIRNGALINQTFATNGVLSAFQNGTLTGTNGVQIGGGGGYFDSSLLGGLKGTQYFGRFDYDFTDTLHAYAQVAGNIKKNHVLAEYMQYDMNFSNRNAFLPAAVVAQLPAATGTFRMTGLMSNGPRFDGEAKSNQVIFMTGLNGSLGEYKWAADYVHGETKLDATLGTNVNAQRLAYAFDAVTNSAGQIVCNITLDPNPAIAARGQGCVPLNPFGPTAANPAAFDYVMQPTTFSGETLMDDFSANIAGTPFSTWVGPVNVALSGEWRKQSFSGTSNGQPTDVVDCTGIRFGNDNCSSVPLAPATVWSQSISTSPKVSQTVWEAALEFNAPLLEDKPLVKALDLNGAGRYTSYNTSGDYWTYKVGVDWQILDSLRFRSTRSRDIRAPSLYDLFNPAGLVYVSATDTLTGQSPRVPSRDLSNPNLTAEIGNTFTAGLVWNPVRDLSIALDGYKIKITDAITMVNGSTTAFQNLCYASGGSSPYCALQVRPGSFTNTAASNAVTGWFTNTYNISEIKTYGADVEVNYTSRQFARPVNLRFLASYQPHILYFQPDVPTLDQGGAAFGPLGAAASARVRLTGLVRFQPMENFTVDIMERWRSAMKLGGDPSQVWVSNHIASYATTNINLNYRTEPSFGEVEYYFNIQNLFDRDPPPGAFSGNGTRSGLRDGYAIGDSPLGRYFTAGVRIRL